MESDGEILFFKELPILELFGSRLHIGVDVPYDVDPDVQLVCKYLKACKEDSMFGKRIDRLYLEEDDPLMRIILRTGSKPPQGLIKFSTDPDLSDEECHRLLQESMPPHVAMTKITQQLFVRYNHRDA